MKKAKASAFDPQVVAVIEAIDAGKDLGSFTANALRCAETVLLKSKLRDGTTVQWIDKVREAAAEAEHREAQTKQKAAELNADMAWSRVAIARNKQSKAK